MKTVHTLAITIFIFFIAGYLQAATVVFEHSGAADPQTEGWNYSNSDPGHVSMGSVSNDLGAGIGAWYVDDTSVALYTTGGYSQNPSQAQLNNAALGWELATTMRVLTPSTGYYPHTMHAAYNNGTTYWLMYFGIDASSNHQFVRLITGQSGIDIFGATYDVGSGPDAYHTYSLRFDPDDGLADLFVDGVQRISGYGGMPSSNNTPAISWGAGASNATGLGHYNQVKWQVVPIPGALWLLGSGLLVFFGVRLRHRTR